MDWGNITAEFAGSMAAGIVGIAGVIYTVKEKFGLNKKCSDIEGRYITFIEKLESTLSSERSKSARLEESIDRIAKERNEAVQVTGKLETRLDHLDKTVTLLSKENASLHEQIATLMSGNRELMEANQELLRRTAEQSILIKQLHEMSRLNCEQCKK